MRNPWVAVETLGNGYFPLILFFSRDIVPAHFQTRIIFAATHKTAAGIGLFVHIRLFGLGVVDVFDLNHSHLLDSPILLVINFRAIFCRNFVFEKK